MTLLLNIPIVKVQKSDSLTIEQELDYFKTMYYKAQVNLYEAIRNVEEFEKIDDHMEGALLLIAKDSNGNILSLLDLIHKKDNEIKRLKRQIEELKNAVNELVA